MGEGREFVEWAEGSGPGVEDIVDGLSRCGGVCPAEADAATDDRTPYV